MIPEVLIPAGNMEKMKIAVQYGANAVYLAGQNFGLRSASDNFTQTELAYAVEFAHQRGVKVYVVLNSFLHDKDLEELPSFVRFLEKIAVDAVIVSDLGVVSLVRTHSSLSIHLSTQASCLNVESALWWKRQGVKRLILGREVGLKEAGKIKRASGLEVELFIHGSMCMAYSGNCTISNFTQGRDSNRGGCAHSCRFEYSFEKMNEEASELAKKKSFFMSSKDLQGLRQLPLFIEEEIDSIKVEGRMKSHLYAATTAKIYSEALTFYRDNGHFYSEKLDGWAQELEKLVHRNYTTASLLDPAGQDSIDDEREHAETDYAMLGVVLELSEKFMFIEVRNALNAGDELELLPFTGPSISFRASTIENMMGESVLRTRPSTIIRLPRLPQAAPHNLLRMRKSL